MTSTRHGSNFEIINGRKLRSTVRAIVVNETNNFLLVQPHSFSPEFWGFVGGGIDSNEDSWEALRRELREEVGITKPLLIRPSPLRDWYLFSEHHKTKYNLDFEGQSAIFFWVRVSNEIEIDLQTQELRAFCWAAQDKALGLIKSRSQIDVFEKLCAEHLIDT